MADIYYNDVQKKIRTGTYIKLIAKHRGFLYLVFVIKTGFKKE